MNVLDMESSDLLDEVVESQLCCFCGAKNDICFEFNAAVASYECVNCKKNGPFLRNGYYFDNGKIYKKISKDL